MLKRLYLQQSWSEILEQADSTFSRGANHLWLDLQWYIHQALVRSGQDVLADIIIADLKGLLRRLTGLETLAFNDGTPFADEVTLNWIIRVYSTICPSGRMSQYRLPAALITTFWPLNLKRSRRLTLTVSMLHSTGFRRARALNPLKKNGCCAC
ncbi:type VI secretion-associated protein, VC_A0119 family [Klebsiella pneumoniae]|uniref:Type VI secretion-associated protein, VC_A0119 family n=1 Tax=Klebsiella pneumoniae TaxID=573 RepID=A0A4P0Y445_KLEPN|nr:type VI secretion-associated protein, VC_A0119 family [Klebsiella pneumoniae]